MEICGEEEHLTVIPNEIKNNSGRLIKNMITRAIKSGSKCISENISQKNMYSKLNFWYI